MTWSRLPATVMLALSIAASPAIAEDTPSPETLWAMLKAQQAEIAALKTRLAEAEAVAQRAQARTAVAEERLDATTDYLEQNLASAAEPSRTTIGGYGEMHYNNHDADDSSRDLEEIDFHRFVVFLGHEFTDRIRFFSEVEIEHSLVKDTDDGSGNGEVEIEQAYIEMDLNTNHYLRSGLFLLPAGIINSTHEPPTFYGVERNSVESVIIPATWWEGGADIGGRYGNGFSWDFAIHSGLAIPTEGANAFRVRSGRQKVSNASTEHLAATASLRYTGVPGLELGATLQYQDDASQISGDGLEEGLMTAIHAALMRGGFGFRALWARWDFDGFAVEAAGADKQDGWYVEPSYRFNLVGEHDIGLYTRYEEVDGARTQDQFSEWRVGLNYWPTANVVFKLDVRDREHDEQADEGRDFTGFDLGVGYQF